MGYIEKIQSMLQNGEISCVELTEKYLKEYPAVGISKICDYFSWDYEETFSEYNYTLLVQG